MDVAGCCNVSKTGRKRILLVERRSTLLLDIVEQSRPMEVAGCCNVLKTGRKRILSLFEKKSV